MHRLCCLVNELFMFALSRSVFGNDKPNLKCFELQHVFLNSTCTFGCRCQNALAFLSESWIDSMRPIQRSKCITDSFMWAETRSIKRDHIS